MTQTQIDVVVTMLGVVESSIRSEVEIKRREKIKKFLDAESLMNEESPRHSELAKEFDNSARLYLKGEELAALIGQVKDYLGRRQYQEAIEPLQKIIHKSEIHGCTDSNFYRVLKQTERFLENLAPAGHA